MIVGIRKSKLYHYGGLIGKFKRLKSRKKNVVTIKDEKPEIKRSQEDRKIPRR